MLTRRLQLAIGQSIAFVVERHMDQVLRPVRVRLGHLSGDGRGSVSGIFRQNVIACLNVFDGFG